MKFETFYEHHSKQRIPQICPIETLSKLHFAPILFNLLQSYLTSPVPLLSSNPHVYFPILVSIPILLLFPPISPNQALVLSNPSNLIQSSPLLLLHSLQSPSFPLFIFTSSNPPQLLPILFKSLRSLQISSDFTQFLPIPYHSLQSHLILCSPPQSSLLFFFML